jgi:hypothetical protein
VLARRWLGSQNPLLRSGHVGSLYKGTIRGGANEASKTVVFTLLIFFVPICLDQCPTKVGNARLPHVIRSDDEGGVAIWPDFLLGGCQNFKS